MKKLLILLSLTTAMTAFADTPTTLPASKGPQGNAEKSATMNINATVIRPLTVEAENMEFGRVIQGTEATATAKYTIKGEPNQAITITIDKPTELTNPTNKVNLPITLTHNEPNVLDNSGDASFDINGSITPSNKHLGAYTGTIVATVIYN